MQTVRIVARTVEQIVTDSFKMTEEFKEFCGRAAGFCYMSDDYDKLCEQGADRANNRAESAIKRGHTSVFGHAMMSLELNVPKAIAMILNSLGVYNTSEKSARYTVMKPETEKELVLYNKWIRKIQEAILVKYPDYDDSAIKGRLDKIADTPDGWKCIVSRGTAIMQNCSTSCVYNTADMYAKLNDMVAVIKNRDDMPSYKLAMENARYMISVFTPTSMMYTISYRQICLIIGYMEKLSEDCKKVTNNSFYRILSEHAGNLSRDLRAVLANNVPIKDNKNQRVRFLADTYNLGNKADTFGDSYTATYMESLAALAQAERHRTLRYSMSIGEDGSRCYYIPPILESEQDREEWLEDIQSIEYCVPQGTLVKVTEQGIFEDFALKCKERLCGRAQLEIMLNTKETLQKFIENKENLCDYNMELLHNMIETTSDGTNIKARCGFNDFKCTDGCRWGLKNGVDRKV